MEWEKYICKRFSLNKYKVVPFYVTPDKRRVKNLFSKNKPIRYRAKPRYDLRRFVVV